MDLFRGDPLGTQRNASMIRVVVYALMPLGIALVPAQITNACNDLMESLNQVRIEYGDEYFIRVTWLRDCLMQKHGGTGLGFTVMGVVIDTPFLKSTFATIVTVGSTVIPVVYAMQGDHEEFETVACDLSPTERSVIEGVVRGMLTNTSCSYVNFTLDSFLGEA